MTIVCSACGGPWNHWTTSCGICGGQQARAESDAVLQGKIGWLRYLEQWLESHESGTVADAWADFQNEHPDIANGPGFVTQTAHTTAHDHPQKPS